MIARRVSLASALLCGALVPTIGAQSPVGPTPRTADGRPDLSGVYQASSRRGEWDFEAPGDADRALVGVYGWMAVMETLGFALFFRDRVVAAAGGAAMLPLAVLAARRVWARG